MPEDTPSSALPQRRRPAHAGPVEPGNRATIVFVTVGTKNRQPILANANTHAILRAAWAEATHWLVGRYVIMPDHLHLFCSPGDITAKPLANWIRYWKASVSKTTGSAEGEFWQTDFWDTQLRQHDGYSAKWDYVRNNPVRAGLVTETDDWPYQGELNLLRWHR